MKTQYSRDKRSPVPSNETVSRAMSQNKHVGTRPEILVRKILRKLGLSGYRKNWEKAYGKPDICFPKRKIAIFVHGCFWHHCPKCMHRWPKNNQRYWKKKISRNIKRDKVNIKRLTRDGWKILVLWDCELRQNETKCTKKIVKSMGKALL